MIINYLILIICGIYSVTGIIFWRKGNLYSHPLLTIGAIIVFFITLIATLYGLQYFELRYIIERLI